MLSSTVIQYRGTVSFPHIFDKICSALKCQSVLAAIVGKAEKVALPIHSKLQKWSAFNLY